MNRALLAFAAVASLLSGCATFPAPKTSALSGATGWRSTPFAVMTVACRAATSSRRG
jgi:hypothetical protein